MATIEENLQTLKDSTDAIKQAIIDKGGDVSGDITTWAGVISGIQTGGGSSSDEEYIFIGTISYNITAVIITGRLNKNPDTTPNYLLAFDFCTGGLCYDRHYIGSTDSYVLTVDFGEPVLGNEMPALCILNVDYNTGKRAVTPVKFEKEISTDPA